MFSRKIYVGILALTLLIPLTAKGQYYPVQQPVKTFDCGLTGLDATLTECEPVPALAPQSYYITDIKVQTTTGTSGQYALRSGTGTNCGDDTAQVFPPTGSGSDRYNAPINTQAMANISFTTPVKVSAGHALCVIGAQPQIRFQFISADM